MSKTSQRARVVDQVVEDQPSNHKALSSNPSTAKNKLKTNKNMARDMAHIKCLLSKHGDPEFKLQYHKTKQDRCSGTSLWSQQSKAKEAGNVFQVVEH
jgi:hypothetical protein